MLKDAHVFASFSTDDLQKAKEFYSQTLGLTVEEDEKMGIMHVKFADGNQVMIYPKPNHQPATFTVLNFLVDDIKQAVDDLTAKGVAFEQYDMPQMKTDEKGISWHDDSHGMAWFKDPAGNIHSVLTKE
jgi:predicted enzyme related to lactoylglutathione lyase